jgi:alpha-tubulin suppressor-like RCC1 family protein
MGYNGDGGLGIGTYDYEIYEPVPIDTDVTYAVGGNGHSLYIKSDNTLYGMGYNYYWQLTTTVYPFALYSTDATNWTREGITEFKFKDDWNVDEIYWHDAIYANGKFIAGGGEGGIITQIRYSSDGKNWITGSIDNIQCGITGVAYNGTDTYVAVSNVSNFYSDGRPEVFTSSDGINWITGSLNNTNGDALYGITYGGGKFVAGSSNRIVTSTNGIDWTESIPAFGEGTNDSNRFTYGNGTYVATTPVENYNYIGDKLSFTQTFDNKTASFVSSLGTYHAMIIQDGTLYGVGGNGNGQLGLGSTISSFINFQPIAKDVRNVACGQYHTTFVKNDSTLWNMGDDLRGLYTNRRSPVQIDANVSQSFGGVYAYYGAAYIKNNKTLWGIGRNDYGQLGTASLGGYVTESVQLDTNVVYASVGISILYIKDDYTLWGIGENTSGQLGTGDNENRTSSVQIDTDVVYCSTGVGSSYYIKNDGTLWATGNNEYGQLGVNDYLNRNTPTLVTSSVAVVSAGFFTAEFVSTDGNVYAMGSSNGSSPLFEINGGTGAIVSVGGGFTYLIAADKKVYSKGVDDLGRLGLNHLSERGLYSYDAETWYSSSLPDFFYSDVSYGNNRFVMVSDSNSIAVSSTDGVNWTSSCVSTSSYMNMSRVLFDGTKFVAVAIYGDYGNNIATSTDGISWTTHNTGDNQRWGSLAYGDGKYVLLADGWDTHVNPVNEFIVE